MTGLPTSADKDRICDVTLDEHSVVRRSPEVEHERAIAIYDLLEDNLFRLNSGASGPFRLHLAIVESRLVFDVSPESGPVLEQIILPQSIFRKIVRDYFMICESYYGAIKKGTLAQIEAIDMGRRGLHNEGAELLRERLAESVVIDENTARRLFTLICVLHIKASP